MSTLCHACQVESGSYRCARCRRATYCSAACQRADWPRHKPDCKSAPDAPTNPRTEISSASPAAASLPAETAARGAVLHADARERPESVAAMRSAPAAISAKAAQSLDQLRSRVREWTHADARGHAHAHGHSSGRARDHGHGHGHSHNHGHGHSHSHDQDESTPGGMLGLALTGAGFEKLVYNGATPPASPSRVPPRTLEELLQTDTWAQYLHPAAERAQAHAERVLKAVRARAKASVGEDMDAATARALWPQVFGEALAREVPVMFADFFRDSSAADAAHAAEKLDALVASPFHVLAAKNFVRDATIGALCGGKTLFGVQDPGLFDGEDAAQWRDAVLDDVLAYARDSLEARDAGETSSEPPLSWSAPRATVHRVRGADGQDVDVSVSVRHVWVDSSDACERTYPALQELLSALHALPYELNRKLPFLRLTRPHPRMTLLRHFHVTVSDASDDRAAVAHTGDGDTVVLYPLGAALQLDCDAAAAARAVSDLSASKLTCTASVGRGCIHPDADVLPVRLVYESVGADATTSTDAAVPMTTGNRLLLHRSRAWAYRHAIHVSRAALSSSLHRSSSADVFTVTFHVHGIDDRFAS